MRTTVEITDAQRAKLLRLAASRGEKGFSVLVHEAIDLYLRTQVEAARRARVKAALTVLGTFSDKDAEALREATRALRKSL
ncbi:MAG: hypothetical protein L6Q95_06170 [Planctomycetes bacterium]|nr:hypothetical protein [Planctomycetota bacterium]